MVGNQKVYTFSGKIDKYIDIVQDIDRPFCLYFENVGGSLEPMIEFKG